MQHSFLHCWLWNTSCRSKTFYLEYTFCYKGPKKTFVPQEKFLFETLGGNYRRNSLTPLKKGSFSLFLSFSVLLFLLATNVILLWQIAFPYESRSIITLKLWLAGFSFICQAASARRQRSDLFGLRAMLPPVISSLTTQ